MSITSLFCMKCGALPAVVPWFCRHITLCRECSILHYTNTQQNYAGIAGDEFCSRMQSQHIFLTREDLQIAVANPKRIREGEVAMCSKRAAYTAAYALYGDCIRRLWQAPSIPEGTFADKVAWINAAVQPTFQFTMLNDEVALLQSRTYMLYRMVMLRDSYLTSEELDAWLCRTMQICWVDGLEVDRVNHPGMRSIRLSNNDGRRHRPELSWVPIGVPLSLVFNLAGMRAFDRDMTSRLHTSQTIPDLLWLDCNPDLKPLPLPGILTRRFRTTSWRNCSIRSRCLKLWLAFNDNSGYSEAEVQSISQHPPLLNAIVDEHQEYLDIWDDLRETWTYWISAIDESRGLIWITGSQGPIDFRLCYPARYLYEEVAQGMSALYGVEIRSTVKVPVQKWEEPEVLDVEKWLSAGAMETTVWENDEVRFELITAVGGSDTQINACREMCTIAMVPSAKELAPDIWKRVFQESRPELFVHTFTCAAVGAPSARDLRRLIRMLAPYSLTDSDIWTLAKRSSEFDNFLTHTKRLTAQVVNMVLRCKGFDLLAQPSTEFYTRAQWLCALNFPAAQLVHRPVQRSILPLEVVEQIVKRVPLRGVVNMYDDFIEARVALASATDDKNTDGSTDWIPVTENDVCY